MAFVTEQRINQSRPRRRDFLMSWISAEYPAGLFLFFFNFFFFFSRPKMATQVFRDGHVWLDVETFFLGLDLWTGFFFSLFFFFFFNICSRLDWNRTGFWWNCAKVSRVFVDSLSWKQWRHQWRHSHLAYYYYFTIVWSDYLITITWLSITILNSLFTICYYCCIINHYT